MRNISIIWDFDGTLIPDDSTTKTVEVVQRDVGSEQPFWDMVHAIHGQNKPAEWEHILAMDAPTWMYALSRIAEEQSIPLNAEFFKEFVVPNLNLYDGVIDFLNNIKSIENQNDFKKLDLKIHHFIVSAGLRDLIKQVFPEGLITWTFGCCYTVVVEGADARPRSVPVYCVDETYKTRSLFEIAKGVFASPHVSVNKRMEAQSLWSPFSNMIYIGDGPTDVPSLSLVRDKGGIGIAVYDPKMDEKRKKKRFEDMRLDKRTDLITAADFSLGSELHQYIVNRCNQIRQRYEASVITDS